MVLSEGTIFTIALFVVMVIFGIVFIIVNKKKEQKSKELNKVGGSSKGNVAKNSKTPEEIRREDVFKFMDFEKITDNMIVQKGNSRYTMAIKCKGINYDLMSEVEQMSVEEGFITFLNTLKYPIQFYVQAQNIDLKGAISKYKENISGIRNKFETVDYEYTKMLERFDTTDEEIANMEKERNQLLNVYEYASDIINYVERMSLNKNLLQRSFYILVSYNKAEVAAADSFSNAELESICYTELLTRCQGIINSLSASSVEGRVLDSNELADLLYTAYNRDDKGIMNVREAIDSGFYRLYSTSKDAFYKKNKVLNEQIENEARIKAIEALKDSINKGTYSSPTTTQLEVTEQVSKIAVEMVKNENVPEEIKNAAKKSIIEEYKYAKRQLMQQLSNEQEAILNANSQELAAKVGDASNGISTNNSNVSVDNSNLQQSSMSEQNYEENYTSNIADTDNNNVEANNEVYEPEVQVSRNLQIEEPQNVGEINEVQANVSDVDVNTDANMHINNNQESYTNESNSLFDDSRLSDEEDDEII